MNGSKNARGDTIVEVMVAITIIGLALAAGYALSNRSFRTGQNTVERTQALLLADSQVEFLRNLGLNGELDDLLKDSAIKSGEQFCFNGENGEVVKYSTGDYCAPYGPSDDESLFDIAIAYCDGSDCQPAGVFTINASWDMLGGRRGQLELYYKVPDYSVAISPTTPPTPGAPPTPGTPPAPNPYCQTQFQSIDREDLLYFNSALANVQKRINLSPTIKRPCTLNISGETFDEDHPNAFNDEQIHEQIFFELYKNTSPSPTLVYRTGLTPDIPNGSQRQPFSFNNIMVTDDVDFILVKHVSIYPDCYPGMNPAYYPQCRNSTNSVHGVDISITAL